MKYVLLDTNIVIDMVVDRRHQMSGKLLESFIKLLDYNEIKLIIPKIVEFETYKHLEEELEQVGKNIQSVMDKIKDLYGIETYQIAGLDIEEYKKESRKQLNQALEMFQSRKSDYKNELFNTIKMVFEHRNSNIITDDDFLNNLVMRRRIYKKAPFHKEQKDSFADGLITETLVNVEKFIEIKVDDIIYFVTGNYTDFSDTGNKDMLHPHIIEDLEKAGLKERIVYVRKFGQLIQKELIENVKNANLSEEFQKELEQEEERERSILESDCQDMVRESAGLSSLGDFESKMEDDLVDSNFQVDIANIFERINECYSILEEFYMFYDDELFSYIRSVNISEVNEILKVFKKVFEKFGGYDIEGNKISDFFEILEWIEEQKFVIRDIPYEKRLPDHIEFGNKIEILDCKHKEFYFELEELWLSPDNGSSDQINIIVKKKDGQICAKGYISVTYGFIEFDDDGGAADGCEEEISYYSQDITDFLEEIAVGWEKFIEGQRLIVEYLRKVFSI